MEHHFNIVLAQEYGIEESILIHNLYYWIHKNACNNKHCHEERYWTYNTTKAFASLFPYMNETKIFRSLKKLEECGFIIKGNFNEMKTDRTCWYAFSDFAIERLVTLGYDAFHFVKTKNGDLQNEMTIPNNKDIDNNIEKEKEIDKSISKKKEPTMPTEEEHQMFEEFRLAYQGRKRGHDTEFDFFISQNKDWREVLPLLIGAITKENKLREEARAMRKFFPEQKNMQTYLNGKNRAWELYVEDTNASISTPTESKGEVIIGGIVYR